MVRRAIFIFLSFLALSNPALAEKIRGLNSLELIEATKQLDETYRNDIWKIEAVKLLIDGGMEHRTVRFFMLPASLGESVCEVVATDLHSAANGSDWRSESHRFLKSSSLSHLDCAKDEKEIDSYIQVVGLDAGQMDFLAILNAIYINNVSIVKSVHNSVYEKSQIILIERIGSAVAVLYDNSICQFEVKLARVNGKYSIQEVNTVGSCKKKI